MKTRTIRPLTTVSAIGFVVAFFGFVASVGANLACSFSVEHAPTRPDPARGIIVPISIRSGTHYVSRDFAAFSSTAMKAQGLFMILGGAVGVSILVRRSTV
jgi:hypothetical protein